MKYSKKISLVIICLGFTFLGWTQEFSGVATYKSSSIFEMSHDSSAMSLEQMAALKQQLMKQMQKEYTLNFDRSTSSWRQTESLGAGPATASSNGMEMMIMSTDDNAMLYKNIASKQFERSTEMMGKRFIVKDELSDYNWKLTDEFKKIGSYNCQKAIYERIVDAKRFATGMEEMELTKDTIKTVAWFTTEIPVSNGPQYYYGLPGLILELKTGRQVLICTQIVLNPSEGVKIERPKKGKVVDQKAYDLLENEKMKEMMNRYSGSGDGEIEIVIGG